MTPLSRRLAEAKAGRSIDAIVAQARSGGHEIDRSTVARYVAGDGARRPPEPVLQALAAGLGLDVRELRELAGLPLGELGPWVPAVESAQLSLPQRKALDRLIRTMVVAETEVAGSESGGPESGGAEALAARESGLPQARRRREREQDADAQAPDGEGPEAGA